jgi:hypothetical protein
LIYLYFNQSASSAYLIAVITCCIENEAGHDHHRPSGLEVYPNLDSIMPTIRHQYKTLGFSTVPIRGVRQQRFSWSLTQLVHRFPEDGRFERAMQLAEFNHIAGSRAAQMAIAENYVGLPV